MNVSHPYSTRHIDYLRRSGLVPSPVSEATEVSSAPERMRRLFRVKEIGVRRKQWDPKDRSVSEKRVYLPIEDVITGLYGCNVPVAFSIRSRAEGTSINLGVWAPTYQPVQAEALDAHAGILKASLNTLYPAILYGASDSDMDLTEGGLVLGTPTVKLPDVQDGALAIDRLVRALSGENWACLILAWPLAEDTISQIRATVVNEMRTVQSAVQAEKTPSPLAEQYLELLKPLAKTLTSGQATGAWRTAVYLLGDTTSYRKLSAVWRGIYSGDDSTPEPIRVYDYPQAAQLAKQWAMPDTPCPSGPGNYQHPLQCQTILSSAQLAGYIHLPQIENNGFGLKLVPGFDAVPSVAGGATPIRLGKVVPRSKLLPPEPPKDKALDEWARDWYEQELPETYYDIGLKALTKHVFVAGVTGSGKTKTVFQILKKVTSVHVPFLVIEPAKTEYRELLHHPEFNGNLQIFTVGNEQFSPFRLNPFEVLPGTSISEHIDLLRSVFSVSFGLWTPLPQILEQCLHLAYADKGWDITRNFNRRSDPRLRAYDPRSFPTLGEFLQRLDELTAKLEWDKEAAGRIRGSLNDRLRTLRAGGKGRMFDTRRSLPADMLFERPTVLELEGLGDDDDKAFMMGLLLIRLFEYQRGSKKLSSGAVRKSPLKHLLVFEEAHRLLGNVSSKGEEGAANPRAKAVESFSNLLSEIRAYGQGVIVADQVPVKLAPDVIKNTNLKILHRIVDLEDRKVMAGAMQMDDQQMQAVGTLLPGRAAIFSEGDDAPLLVQIPLSEDKEKPDDHFAKAHMAKATEGYRDLFLPHAHCKDIGRNSGAACTIARDLVETTVFRRDFVRLVMSMIEDPNALERLWPLLQARVDTTLPQGIARDIARDCLASRASHWFAFRRGAQGQWPFAECEELSANLRKILLQCGNAEAENILPDLIESFRAQMMRLYTVQHQPFSHCGRICDAKPTCCLYRHAVTDLIEKGDYNQAWDNARVFTPDEANGYGARTWVVCRETAAELLETTDPQANARRRVSLCFGQLMFNRTEDKSMPGRLNEVIDGLCTKSTLPPEAAEMGEA